MEQEHDTCDPIRPEDVPDDLVAVFHRAHVGTNRDEAVRAALASVLTEVCEQIATAVEKECIDPDWPNDDISANGKVAAAVVRSWPEELEDV